MASNIIKAKSTLSKTQQFKLRMQLLGLWFLKNLSTFLWTFIFVGIILVCTGVIDENTPLLGILFGGLSKDIETLVTDNGGNMDILSALGSGTSIILITSTFAAKLKSLALSDVKSKKIKVLLIRAGLYFDEDGKLTRRIERITNIDLNNDGKIDNVDIGSMESNKNESVISGLKRAKSELVTILKVDLSEKEEEDIYQTVALSDVKNGIDEEKETVTSTKVLGESEPEETTEKVGIIKRIKNTVINMFAGIKKGKELSAKEESGEDITKTKKEKKNKNNNNVEEIKENPIIEVIQSTAETVEDQVTNKVTEVVSTATKKVETVVNKVSTSSNDLDDFISGLKRN